MASISGQEFFLPKTVNDIFVDITKRRHPSGDEDEVREYVAEVIKGLQEKGMPVDLVFYDKDAKEPGDRVIVAKRSASKGKEDAPKMVLQAHMDMVCKPHKDITPLKLYIEVESKKGEEDIIWLKACQENGQVKTTLGADDGIGVAVALAILSDDTLNLGQIECLFTVEEETGMGGAKGFKKELLEGRTYINLDSEDKEIITFGSAGGLKSSFSIPCQWEEVTDDNIVYITLSIYGLLSGHSGVNIHEGRANAIQLMARALFALNERLSGYENETFHYQLVRIDANDTDNVIPGEAEAVVAIDKSAAGSFIDGFYNFCKALKEEISDIEKNFRFKAEKESTSTWGVLTKEASDQLISLLMTLPHGVLRMSASWENIVETSTNLAVVKTLDKVITISCSHRSLKESELIWVRDIHRAIAKAFSIEIKHGGNYPPWTPNPHSSLLNMAKVVYQRHYEDYKEEVIHAGLECSWIVEKYKEEEIPMDCIAIGPTMKDPHTGDERLDTKSVAQFWDCLIEILNTLSGNV